MSIQCITLRDDQTQSRADILVGFGLNCYRFETHLNGRRVSVIWSEEGFDTGRLRPSGSGIPLLFPFPGRIQGTQLQWQGRAYELPAGDGRGNAIHGFVHGRPWRLLDQGPQQLTAQFQAASDAPELLPLWPSDFRLTVVYRLTGRVLSAEFLVENPGEQPLPFGLGTHPYFRLPLGAAGAADDCQIALPVSSQWELVDMNATGQRVPLSDAATLQRGARFADLQLDCVFSGLQASGQRCHARIDDPSDESWVCLDFDAAFRECVVYTPGTRQAICIEPYTCVPDCFRLQPQGIDAGLRLLEPGAEFRTDLRIEVGQGR